MKKTKVIIPALGLLVLSTAASITGTVAWFSANNKVNVTGMNVTTQVKGNLLIAENNSSDANYSSSNLDQVVSGQLEPVSTINGANFFYTVSDVKGDGSTTVTTFAEYTNDQSGNTAFNTAYGTTDAVGYVDYNFYIKATSDIDQQNVIISEFNLLYDGAPLRTTTGKEDRAWRVAVFANAVEKADTSTSATTIKSILGPASAAYFESKAVAAASGNEQYAAVPTFGARAVLGQIATKGTTQRYRVVVRLYLEGNDTTCNNDTYADLAENYQLALSVELGTVSNSNTEGANVISSTQIVEASNTNLAASVAVLPQGVTASAYQWQKKTDGAWGNVSGTEANYNGAAGDILRCKVTTSIGVYYSNSITLPNA